MSFQRFFVLDPEVAGGWGEGTRADTSVHPPIVAELHYAFDGWLGDVLLQTFPCFIVTERLASTLVARGLTGFELDEVRISRTQQFLDLYPNRELPRFGWLRVGNHPRSDDFGLTDETLLVVSEAALNALKEHQLEHCTISEYG